MKKEFMVTAALLAFSACANAPETPPNETLEQTALTTNSVPLIVVDDLQFRDLNRDGSLATYEDWREAPANRAADLLRRMTVAEKIGQMAVGNLMNNAPFGQPATAYDSDLTGRLVTDANITHVISRLSVDAKTLATANNEVQAVAERGRLGIPAVIMTDPRHGNTELEGASLAGGWFSQWPNGVGIAALGDADLTEAYAAIVRDDLRAVGLTVFLGPQIDLASEPRWPRNFDTLGEDPELSASLAPAFVRGLQGSDNGIAPGGVAAVIKHFAGYSASDTGFDAHNYYGRHSRVSIDEWPDQIRPFEGALAATPSGVMPSYSIVLELEIDGQPLEPTGAGYLPEILQGELRDRLGFEGIILSDWAITNDCSEACINGTPPGVRPSFESISTAWGVQHLSRPERFAKSIHAGMDQFGGVDDTAPIQDAFEAGLISEAQINAAVLRILTQTFKLGLFEAPFVDADAAEASVGTSEEIALGRQTQARSMVLLETDRALNISPGTRVVLSGLSEEAAIASGLVPVEDPETAELAILRTHSPSELLHPGYVFGAMQQEGSLAFPEDYPAVTFMSQLPDDLPLVADVQLDRAAILTPMKNRANILVASFGTSDAAFLTVLSGAEDPVGRLPVELPSSMAAVEAQRPGKPADSVDPLYPLGYRFER